MSRAFIVGRGRRSDTTPEVVREVETVVRSGGWTTDSLVVSKKRELRRAAVSSVKDGYDIVVAVGGDEEVAQAATSLAGSLAALGIVPTTSGDLVAPATCSGPGRVASALRRCHREWSRAMVL